MTKLTQLLDLVYGILGFVLSLTLGDQQHLKAGSLMKFWKYIELDDGIGQGLTEEGVPFWEVEIQGWNDNETFTDLTSLVKITAIDSPYDSEIELNVEYNRPELEHDLMIGKLVDEAKIELQSAVSAFRQSERNL
ncbi:hypothetical protein QWY22_10895 [Planococcus liqunii]|uniref:Uncharacterized protein n=2 Tax=Planococcus glaciei TaxID=459472 RepID=A0A7H8QG61_9BACL|nr:MULTISPECIES: hypothetical protein [Planococcus]QKX52223.1 hypothetical protein HF394_17495 [Planococcus glaciei]WKA49412.1 hypothetical protein QWY22_10895 [Planococcus sp. N056]